MKLIMSNKIDNEYPKLKDRITRSSFLNKFITQDDRVNQTEIIEKRKQIEKSEKNESSTFLPSNNNLISSLSISTLINTEDEYDTILTNSNMQNFLSDASEFLDIQSNYKDFNKNEKKMKTIIIENENEYETEMSYDSLNKCVLMEDRQPEDIAVQDKMNQSVYLDDLNSENFQSNLSMQVSCSNFNLIPIHHLVTKPSFFNKDFMK